MGEEEEKFLSLHWDKELLFSPWKEHLYLQGTLTILFSLHRKEAKLTEKFWDAWETCQTLRFPMALMHSSTLICSDKQDWIPNGYMVKTKCPLDKKKKKSHLNQTLKKWDIFSVTTTFLTKSFSCLSFLDFVSKCLELIYFHSLVCITNYCVIIFILWFYFS